jgi:hypothetical protein
LHPLCGVCLARVKKNGSNGFIAPLTRLSLLEGKIGYFLGEIARRGA